MPNAQLRASKHISHFCFWALPFLPGMSPLLHYCYTFASLDNSVEKASHGLLLH